MLESVGSAMMASVAEAYRSPAAEAADRRAETDEMTCAELTVIVGWVEMMTPFPEPAPEPWP